MKDHEIEKAFMDMTASDVPDLWDRIDAATPVSMGEKTMENKKKRSWKEFLFGGGTFRTAVAICLVVVIGAGLLNAVGGGLRMGSSASGGTYTAAAVEEKSAAYNSDAAYGYAAGDASGASYDMEAAEEMEPIDGLETPMADAGGGAVVNSSAAVTAETSAAQAADVSGEAAQSAADTARKLIRRLDLDVETLEFDQLVEELKKRTTELGGYIESSSISGTSYNSSYKSSRYASLTLRIPQTKTDTFLNEIGEMANVLNRTENVEDVTLTYVDLESHVNVLKEEQARLTEMLGKAETVEDMMSIESYLSDIRYQLESYASQLKLYDNLVTYDTVTLYIQEVTKETPTAEPTLWQRITRGFADNLVGLAEDAADLLVWLIAGIPYFIALFVIIFIIIKLIKWIGGRKKDGGEKKPFFKRKKKDEM